MFFGKVLSTAVLGLTALAGLATASVVPIHNRDIAPKVVSRAAVNTTEQAIAIVTNFQAKVNSILPKLVDVDRAGQDTTSVFNTLFQAYDDTNKAISSLPQAGSQKEVEPTPAEKKFIDISNETLNSVNAVVNILNSNDVNLRHAKTLQEKTNQIVKSLNLVIIIWPWPIVIIIVIRRVAVN